MIIATSYRNFLYLAAIRKYRANPMNDPSVKVFFLLTQKCKGLFLLILGVSLHLSLFAQPETSTTEAQGPKKLTGAVDTRLSTIQYPSGSIKLDEAAKEELDYIVMLVQTNPDLKLAVQGHSDDQGSIARHQYLSEYRAWLAWAYLVAHGVPHQNITHYGFGFRKPKVADVTPKAREENRRVEIHVVLPKIVQEEVQEGEKEEEKKEE